LTRLDHLLAHVDLEKTGIEVAPYFNPALPKAKYPKVLTLDVFDTATLRARAAEDSLIRHDKIAQIENVDLVGDASRIGAIVSDAGLVGKIGYIVSSHNFEHLPNPIRFLRGCSEVMERGGVLSMAVPDARACFDIFRTPTRLVDWLTAYHFDYSQPSPATLFDFHSNTAPLIRLGAVSPGTDLRLADPAEFRLTSDLRETYTAFVSMLENPGEYRDAHCTVMFPETLELMLRDLRYIGLIDLDIIEVSQTVGIEFFVHLRKPVTEPPKQDSANYLAQRQVLMERINENLGAVHFRRRRYLPHPKLIPVYAKSFVRKLIGDESYRKLRAANKARRRK
jgi:hypothetical protein